MNKCECCGGEAPIDFKKAVFLSENAFYKDTLSYSQFCNDIDTLVFRIKKIMDKTPELKSKKTFGNWAVWAYMKTPLPENHHLPFAYDFEDFSEDKDISKMFVTKLLRTKSGNCNSMPKLYKILCNEIGSPASLAIAPHHLYIKHKDETGVWRNVELTNSDEWIIQQMGITVDAIKNEVYMHPLTEKQSIALTIMSLAEYHASVYGWNQFVLIIINSIPNCVNLHMMKVNCYLSFGLEKLKKEKPDKTFLKENWVLYEKSTHKIEELGYTDLHVEKYEEWVKSIESKKKESTTKKQHTP